MTSSDLNACDAYGNKNVSTPQQVKLEWDFTPDSGKTVSKYSVIFGQKADLSDGFEVVGTSAKSLSFYNSFLGTNYFKVVANYSDGSKKESEIKTFQVTGQAPRNLYVGNMPNCRDMGGRTTYAGGKVKQGLIYRTSGSKFDNSTPSDQTAKDILTKQFKVKTEINVANSTSNNVNLSGTNVVNAYMAYGAVPYSNLARNSVRIRQVMDILADETNYPVFYHCRIGTDRTGITGIMINGLLGVPFNEAIQDYGFSNFAPIDNQRYPGKTPDNNGDDIKKYIDELLALPGANFQEQVYLALRMIGVPAAKLDKIIDIMTVGTKATIPATAKIGEDSGLETTVSKTTKTDYKSPATYYAIPNNGSIKFKTTTTAGKKDVIVYMGYTGSVSTSTSTKLSAAISLRIDDAEQTIASTKNLWQAGFGSTQQDNRIGYMFNVLGNYDFTGAEHTVEISSKSGTFNVGSITIADHAA
jgi:protein-tyrosine phosphatase